MQPQFQVSFIIMILETTNVIMNLGGLLRNDRDRSVFRICSIITAIYIKFENIIDLQLKCLFYIKNNKFR